MPPTEQYSKWVREYPQQKLTHGSDAINMFGGVLQFLESTLETRYYSALPEVYVDWALLWAQVLDLTYSLFVHSLSNLQRNWMKGKSPLPKITWQMHTSGMAERLLLDCVRNLAVPFQPPQENKLH